MRQRMTSLKELVLLTRENEKLGPGVPVFNLPAGVTCPGRSQWCYEDNNCYALKIERIRPVVRHRYERNLRWIKHRGLAAFVEQVNREIAFLHPPILRIHADGDFYSAPYIKAWAEIAKSNPDVRFWAYTRSWRIKGLVKALEGLKSLPNVEVFASWDNTIEDAPPPGWRIAAVPVLPDGEKGMTCLTQIKDQQGDKVRSNCLSCMACLPDPNNPATSRLNILFVKH